MWLLTLRETFVGVAHPAQVDRFPSNQVNERLLAVTCRGSLAEAVAILAQVQRLTNDVYPDRDNRLRLLGAVEIPDDVDEADLGALGVYDVETLSSVAHDEWGRKFRA